MTYRLIALDLDGTALGPDRRIRQATLEAVAKAGERGIRTIVATGRHHRMARGFHADLNIDTPLIACNGACLHDCLTGAHLLARPLPEARSRAILDVIRRHDVFCHVYTADLIHYERENDVLRSYLEAHETVSADIRATFRRSPAFDALIDEDASILKFVIFNNERAHVDACLAEIRALDDLSCEWSWAIGADIAHAGNTKGRALVEWAASVGIAADEIIAFGDNHNDLTMLDAAGLGIAMGNADATVRAAADLVIGPHDTDAIAEAIQRFVL